MQTLFKSLIAFTAAMFFAGSALARGPMILDLKEYSSDNRLMNNVNPICELENGMVIHAWEWSDFATDLDAKYGASQFDGGFMPAGIIAQDFQAVYPQAVIEDANGFLTIDRSALNFCIWTHGSVLSSETIWGRWGAECGTRDANMQRQLDPRFGCAVAAW